MKRLMLLFVIGVKFTFCKTESGNYECFQNQVGLYRFDAKTTMGNSDRLGKYYDINSLSYFRIIFKSDSTFHANMQVDFFSDTVGAWESGTCGFESSGLIKYYTSPSVEQFGVCHKGDSFFTKISPFDRGGITLWFRKI